MTLQCNAPSRRKRPAALPPSCFCRRLQRLFYLLFSAENAGTSRLFPVLRKSAGQTSSPKRLKVFCLCNPHVYDLSDLFFAAAEIYQLKRIRSTGARTAVRFADAFHENLFHPVLIESVFLCGDLVESVHQTPQNGRA